MSSTHLLQMRLKEVSSTLSQIQTLVHRLQNWTSSIGQGDEARIELSTEIHNRLKETEEEMELLKVEVDSIDNGKNNRKKNDDIGDKESEKRRVIALSEKLATDLRKTRKDFRNAQLQANRNAEAAKRKERELLFSRREGGGMQRPTEKLTQDDLILNASNDVTAALRRTHDLMQVELSRSQFAQETLEQSTAALSTLSESYSNLDTLLSSSRALVSSLLRSQKSDTWYLETAFYILIGTITWLVFRRILYGPLWWLAWMPMKMMFRFFSSIFGVIGLAGTATSTSVIVSGSETLTITNTMNMEKPQTVATGIVTPGATDAKGSSGDGLEESMIEKIGKMVEGDETVAEVDSQEDQPRNPKKRMWEENVAPARDEL